jgi:hypothetical protein
MPSADYQRDTTKPDTAAWVNPIDTMTHFEFEMINFGVAKKGESVYGRFAFSNVGKTPLEIEMVSTCECIAAVWSEGPIKPGQMGEIILELDTSKEDPEITKTMDIIFHNTSANGYQLVKQLYITGKLK